MNFFNEVARINKSYCASLGLPGDVYDRPLSVEERTGRLSADELKIAQIMENGTNRRAAEMFTALSKMPPAPVRVRPSSIHRCIVEYAKPAQPVSLWDQKDITPYYEECRAKSQHSAGTWVGD